MESAYVVHPIGDGLTVLKIKVFFNTTCIGNIYCVQKILYTCHAFATSSGTSRVPGPCTFPQFNFSYFYLYKEGCSIGNDQSRLCEKLY